MDPPLSHLLSSADAIRDEQIARAMPVPLVPVPLPPRPSHDVLRTLLPQPPAHVVAPMRLADAHERFFFTPVLSEPSGETQRRTGFVHEAVASDLNDFSNWKAYLCGPPIMVDSVKDLLIQHGVQEDDIYADAY